MFFTKLSLLALTSLLSLPAASTTEAAAPGRAAKRDKDGICERLECSDSQEASLAKIMGSMKEKLRAAHGKSGERHASLAAAMRDSSLTKSEVAKAFDKANAADEREAIMVDAFMQVHAVLDAEQRAELATMIESDGMRAVMGKHGGKGHHGKAGKAKAKDDRGPGSLKAKKNGRPSIDDKANGKAKDGGRKAKQKHTSVGSLRAKRG